MCFAVATEEAELEVRVVGDEDVSGWVRAALVSHPTGMGRILAVSEVIHVLWADELGRVDGNASKALATHCAVGGLDRACDVLVTVVVSSTVVGTVVVLAVVVVVVVVGVVVVVLVVVVGVVVVLVVLGVVVVLVVVLVVVVVVVGVVVVTVVVGVVLSSVTSSVVVVVDVVVGVVGDVVVLGEVTVVGVDVLVDAVVVVELAVDGMAVVLVRFLRVSPSGVTPKVAAVWGCPKKPGGMDESSPEKKFLH